MRAVGIVCEYNPFHRGHLYQIEQSRRALGEDAAVVCVQSGDFVQRGEAALFDKHARAEAACRSGADLVVELPLPWCLSQAEGFATGAVSLLAALGCDTLSFGSESAALPALERLADFLTCPDTLPRILARMEAEPSLSFARARQQLAGEALGSDAALLSAPNDILAVEYLRALRRLNAPLRPLAIRRLGSGHDAPEAGDYPSAMALRARMEQGGDISPFLPTPAREVLAREQAAGRMCGRRLLEIALLSRLYTLGPERFETLADAGGGAGRRLWRAVRAGGGPADMVAAAVSKRFPAARMRRMLLCAALGLCADDTKGTPPYVRPLAMNERGREYLAARRDMLPIPTVTRTADLKKAGLTAEKVFRIGADAHDLYTLGFDGPAGRNAGEDWRRNPALV